MQRLYSACVAIAVALAAAASATAAPVPHTRTEPDTTKVLRFDFPAQSLTQALAAFAASTSLTIRLEADIDPAAKSPAVNGMLRLPEALRELLAGSGLQARFTANRTVLVSRQGEEQAPVYNLRPVEVLGTRNGYSTVRTMTATKTDTPLRDTPQSISVVTRDVIADQSMQSMADVTRYVPGVQMALGEGHRDAPTIRGNASTADFFVDGVRDDAQYYRDLYNAERVEALKGSNAMIFGRGGLGGVINRVTKEAEWAAGRVLTFEGGSFQHRRATIDLSQPVNDDLALRLNGVFENSRTFRAQGELQRFAGNPTALFVLSENTNLHASYEFFRDRRTVDRGIPSFAGKPAETHRRAYFGNADSSYAHARVQTASTLFEHRTRRGITIRNRSRFTDYDKFYQNSYASAAVNAAGTQVTLAAYNHNTPRRNLVNQTDITGAARTGPIEHTLLGGLELARQRTGNYRETGYFNNAATTYTIDVDQPTVTVPITFRQSATDADNRTVVTVAALYAQDQLKLNNAVQAVAGLRYERFNIDHHNFRTKENLARTDELLSPRAGLILKPFERASLYASYSVSYLPSSGDQFSSLTATTSTLEPEQLRNYEVGGKWDVRRNLALTLAVYRLNRTNTSAPSPLDPKVIVQTGSQRTKGIEAGLSGDISRNWHVIGAASRQDAEIVSTTSSAKAGSKVALVPEWTYSLWNRYNVRPALGLGFGVVHQSEVFAAIDNTVELPGFTRLDGAVFLRVSPALNAQVNVENLADAHYFASSQGNNNIMPGAGRTFRFSLVTRR